MDAGQRNHMSPNKAPSVDKCDLEQTFLILETDLENEVILVLKLLDHSAVHVDQESGRERVEC